MHTTHTHLKFHGLLLSIAIVTFGLFVPHQVAHSQSSDADTQSEEERLQNRIVPVPNALSDFQAGVLLGLTVDNSKFSENWNFLYDDITAFIDYQSGPFILASSFGVSNQGNFDHEGGGPQADFDHHFLIYEGLLGLVFDQFFASFGWGSYTDSIDSPYSLYLSPRQNPAVNFQFKYTGEVFFFENYWIGLNFNSALTYQDNDNRIQDRGMNYKSAGFKINDPWDGIWKIGYQESVVYTDRYFDPIYFAPIPYPLVQLFTAVSGNPAQVAPDPNNLFGFFLDYTQNKHYAYVQFLLDDLSFNTTPPTLKSAWSVGYRIATDIGRFGFYHAGATKFTYQATRTTNPYPYIRHPLNTYKTRNGDKTIPYFDNYIGYLYGGNNIAFRAEYDNTFGIVEVKSGLEYIVSGEKSPLNPWHGGRRVDDAGGTQLLDSDRLEHTIILNAGVVVNIFEDIDLLFEGSLGYVFNELALTDPPVSDNSQLQYFVPSTNNKFLYSVFVGVQYVYNQHEPEWRKKYAGPQLRK